jgi:hypothetical protein
VVNLAELASLIQLVYWQGIECLFIDRTGDVLDSVFDVFDSFHPLYSPEVAL